MTFAIGDFKTEKEKKRDFRTIDTQTGSRILFLHFDKNKL